MNVFDFALKMELDGEKYYRDQAARTQYNDLKKVLEGLAKDEQRHYEIIKLAQTQTFKDIKVDSSLSKIQNVFAVDKNIHQNNEFIAKLKDEQIDIYREAVVKEKESVELYKKLSEDAKMPDEKMIFEKLMHEEEKHLDVLDQIIDMLNHVNDWVEAAEFNNKDTY